MNGEIKTVRNVYGCAIKCCCASCKHKDIDLEGLHICNLMGLKVQHKYKCSKWEMSTGLTKAGSAQGSVRDIFTKRIILE